MAVSTKVKEQHLWALLRICMGWTFLWAFLDKLYGLGFTTTQDKAWVAGGSPTTGFLQFATHGPLAAFFQGLAGSAVVDWLFMLGLLLIGLALLLGIGMRIACYSGALLLFLMWAAVLPPEHNPFLDEHIIYIIIMVGLATAKSGHTFGLGKWWANTPLVQKFTFLE